MTVWRAVRCWIAACCLLPLGLALAACLGGDTVPAPVQAPQPAPAPSVQAPPSPPEHEVETAALPPGPVVPPGIVRIGLLLPLSGPAAADGQALFDAAQLALFDLGGPEIELLPRDTGGVPERALRAAQDVLAQGAALVLGPLFAHEVSAAAPAARARGVSMIAFSTSPQVAGNGVYLMSFPPPQQVERIAGFAVAQGLRRIALLAPGDAYGRTVAATLTALLPRLGGELAASGFYAPDASNAADVVRQLTQYDRRHADYARAKETLEALPEDGAPEALAQFETVASLGDVPFDAVLLADGGDRLYQVAPLLPYFGVDLAQVRLLGTGLWDDPTALREPTLAGGWFAGTAPGLRAGFEQRFRAAYGYEAPRIATLAYDAVLLAGALARQMPGPDFSVRALTAPQGFAGTDGAFRFGRDGVIERALAVLRVDGGGAASVLSPAPTDFRMTAE